MRWIFVLLLAFTLPDAEPKPSFEVLVVGTLHAPWQFRSPQFHPGYVRASLAAAKPDVVGVESNPEWFARGTFHDVTYAAQGIAVPWARSKAIPVYGIDWMDIKEWERRTRARDQAWAENLRKATPEGRFGGWAFGQIGTDRFERTRKYFEETARHSFREMNDIGTDVYGRRWLKGAGDPKSETFGGRRNREIVKRCVEVMKAHPGKRLVVVIGAGHKAVLDALFEAHPDVRLLRWEKDIPAPTEEEAGKALTDVDRIAVLGHNLDGERSYFHPKLIDLARMQDVLSALSDYKADARIPVYFRARLYGHRGDVSASRVLLQRIVDGEIVAPEGRVPLYPFPMDHWRMEYDVEQAASLELARLLLNGDLRPEVEPKLEALAEQMPDPVGTSGPRWRAAWLAQRFPRWLGDRGR